MSAASRGDKADVPAEWLRGVVRDRLGIEPDELPCGHTPALSCPRELVELLESYRGGVGSVRGARDVSD